MIELRDIIDIDAPVERVYECLVQSLQNIETYKAWHPEHESIEWLQGEPVEEGSIVHIEEYLNGVLTGLTFRFVEVVPNQLIRYRVRFPLSIISPENRFEFEVIGEGRCRFTAYGRIRMPMWLFLKSHPAHAGKLKGTMQHMKEEGESLKRMAERECATGGESA
jgi:uncharacterized protein YndB with AHSA1/START domain